MKRRTPPPKPYLPLQTRTAHRRSHRPHPMCKVDEHQREQTPAMMLDSPHTLASMLMRGNALVLKTPVENAPRTSIEKHLSWSSDIPPAVRLPLHRSRPAEYEPNRQPATVCAESGAGEARRRVGRRRGRLTSGARQSLRALVMQSSAPAPGAQSTWDSALGYRGQHLTVPISTNDLHC
jgi:hypothetical protein